MHRWPGLLVWALLLVIANPSFAQIGTPPLLPDGNLLVSTGNYSEVSEGKGRVYFRYFGGNKVLQYRALDDLTASTTGFLFGLDFHPEGTAYISFGLAQSQGNASQTVDEVNIDQLQETRLLMARFSIVTPEKSVFTVGIAQVNDHRTVDGSSGSFSASGSADHQYSDAQVGFSVPALVDGLRVGAAYSPEVASKTHYSGIFSSIESHAGHGAVVQGGVGYNQQSFSGGLDVYSSSENWNARSAASKGAIVAAELLISQDLTFRASVTAYSSDKLIRNGDYSQPATSGRRFLLGLAKKDGRIVLRATYSRVDETASDFGNQAADADRYKSGTSNMYTLRLVYDL